ncbi:hypothetical protein [Massilia arenae]|uniref:DUF2486 family protein n=1 Tax=Massilia arenae TaxID=2603288 RepID=A0A5C7FPL4_9BURK|nr:hypothetical protein [Massilia arenae]TXF96618.1 hypothetical protein FVD38_23600 [Massilia arenae]
MNQDPAFDTSIPVLTEVVADSPAPAAPVASAAPAAVAAVAITTETSASDDDADTPEALERRAADRWSGEQWSVMERRLTERVLQQLQGRIDFVLEQRLRDGIAEAVDKAMAGFSAEIRTSLHQSLDQVVTRAVSQEIAHLQTLGK